MKITKYGHACLLIEENGTFFLTDPGTYNPMPDAERVDAILITHNHQDHMDPDMIRELLKRHPDAQIIANQEVADSLKEKGITVNTVVKEGDQVEVNGISVHAHGDRHAFIYEDKPNCQNTCFMIADRFYHPGDSLFVPNMPVEVLALPVAGPWMKLGEAIDFTKAIKPKYALPMHDGFYRPERAGSRMFAKMFLEPIGVEFRDMQDGSVEDF